MASSRLINRPFSRVLEVSRQVFAWTESHFKGIFNKVDDPEAPLVRSVYLEELKDGSLDPHQLGRRFEVIQLQGTGQGGEDQDSSSPPRGDRLVRVSVAANCREGLRTLAVTMCGRYDTIENYYIDLGEILDNTCQHKRIPTMSRQGFSTLLNSANGKRHLSHFHS
ncbi:hypothetical protein K469DRAFT_689400 [Zopfia rhizophila CBS 207.26]|uniref:Uncharacterized protein n=1 Tax=Zopfia rhizophila CBS 207.26 TaxID=1314779 RepID=A0A6A6DZ41_9PEZI|nr:hypothetical protein K469DRAFT_689400 [Zopfia rhizophila CBS 207.26]